MINTTLDILYLVLAGAVGLLTVFLVWAIYYVVRMLRNAVYVMEKFTTVLHKADEVLDMAKDKLNSTGTYIGVAANAIQTAIEYFGEKKPARKRTTRKKK